MAAPGPATCAACGRPLPLQLGRGRKRRYCSDRCRDAGRRARARAEREVPGIVNEYLTLTSRQEYIYSVPDAPGASDPVATAIGDAARRLLGELGGYGTGSPLDAVAAARELSAAAATAMQAAVDRARTAGHSWREIGDVLDTTRQAAFQRFGHPVDPRTNTPMSRETLPGAADHAIEILGSIIAGRWEDARRDFDARMLEAVDADRIARVWAMTTAEVGGYERMGEPLVYRVNDATIVDLPLHFEAGDRVGRVAFDGRDTVIGLFIRPPTA
jgi:Protein of unknown function (DUF3887)